MHACVEPSQFAIPIPDWYSIWFPLRLLATVWNRRETEELREALTQSLITQVSGLLIPCMKKYV